MKRLAEFVKERRKEVNLTQKQIESVFNIMIKHKSNATSWIEKSFLSDEMKNKYVASLDQIHAA